MVNTLYTFIHIYIYIRVYNLFHISRDLHWMATLLTHPERQYMHLFYWSPENEKEYQCWFTQKPNNKKDTQCNFHHFVNVQNIVINQHSLGWERNVGVINQASWIIFSNFSRWQMHGWWFINSNSNRWVNSKKNIFTISFLLNRSTRFFWSKTYRASRTQASPMIQVQKHWSLLLNIESWDAFKVHKPIIYKCIRRWGYPDDGPTWSWRNRGYEMVRWSNDWANYTFGNYELILVSSFDITGSHVS